jgi:hypothetical protein
VQAGHDPSLSFSSSALARVDVEAFNKVCLPCLFSSLVSFFHPVASFLPFLFPQLSVTLVLSPQQLEIEERDNNGKRKASSEEGFPKISLRDDNNNDDEKKDKKSKKSKKAQKGSSSSILFPPLPSSPLFFFRLHVSGASFLRTACCSCHPPPSTLTPFRSSDISASASSPFPPLSLQPQNVSLRLPKPFPLLVSSR